ncbi:hypothetical protein [Lysobacter solisilvae (ex Woo and Kim 2020)]|uniref:Uncharacterized protein n=1 Tax=Agrilutibacter terrestris TaxID=2865112 RepID=A0A7H0FWV0_9GAMM|nr:hypothetical protein [Lysobacter terrestris]QNP40516.1 hypothetical protein H8B22_13765 [Lysobacter terrestris]
MKVHSIFCGTPSVAAAAVSAITVLISTLFMAPIRTAQATDFKGISGAACQPATPSDGTALTRSAYGIANVSTVNRSVICALPTDAEDAATAGVDIYFANGTAACALSVVVVDIDLTLTTRVITDAVTCRLGPETRLNSLRYLENATTD